jgi:glutamine amidotransferase
MCRWMSYLGGPIGLDVLLLQSENSLIDQSLSAQRSETPTNGDGFGLGWYGRGPSPGLYRSVRPAWNDTNLRDLAAHIESRSFVAHVRAATDTAVQQSNCHPFRFGRWLFVHNGVIAGFATLRRKLVCAIDPDLFPHLAGTTDSEVMFYLALTFGLEDDPLGALERMAGFVETVGRDQDVEYPLQMTLGLTDGTRLFGVRYSTEGKTRTLYHSADIRALKELSPNDPRLERFTDDACAIVSEPLSDLSQVWIEIPEATSVLVSGGVVTSKPFRPRAS